MQLIKSCTLEIAMQIELDGTSVVDLKIWQLEHFCQLLCSEMFFSNQFKLENAAMDGTGRRTLIDAHTHQVSGVVG